MTLLNMSFYGAVIILAILIIRAFTLHKLPKKTFLILWGVALLRLLIPFEISSGFSLYSLLPEEFNLSEEADVYIPDPNNPLEPFENYADYLKNQNGAQITDDGTIIVDETGGAVYLPIENPEIEAIELPHADAKAQTVADNTSADSTTAFLLFFEHLQPLLPVIWGTGMLLCAVFFIASYIRCYAEFRTSLPVTEEYAENWLKAHSLRRTISIRRSDKISAPLTYGLFRPVILMPQNTDWTNTQQLDYVLYHEFTHIRRFDLAAKLVMIVAVCLHWFNPFVWAMYFFFNRDLELSCDDCVVKHFGDARAAYANTLIGMEEKKNFSTPLCNHFSKNAIEERITAIMKSEKTTVGMVIVAVLIVVTVVVTLTTGRKNEEAATDVTPSAAPTETVAPTPTATITPETTPTLAPGQNQFGPTTNYYYDDTAFQCTTDTISPELGYEFFIERLTLPGGHVFTGISVDLTPYTEGKTWRCRGVFHDFGTKCIYLEFVPSPSAGEELADAGILHVTVPFDHPDKYSVLPLGNGAELFEDTLWSSEIKKLKDRIYFNCNSCTGTLWAVDLTTGELLDLSYVNEKMQEIANDLCAGFDWEHEPAVWFSVTQQESNTVIYTASVCKEIDTGTVLTLHLYYNNDTFIDYQANYYGTTAEPATLAELNSLCQEQFFRYLEMQNELFNTNLACANISSSNDWVTINGVDGYLKVTDTRFPTLQSIIDHMETICTPAFAEYLQNQFWHMNDECPTLAELNGELYTQCYDAVMLGESYSFAPVRYDWPDTCTLSYEAYIGIPANKTESGTVTFRCVNGVWYVSNHTYTCYNDFVDGLDIRIMTELFSKYRTMWMELFNSNLECGYYSNPPAEEITIQGISGYYKVLDERFPTMQSLIDYMEAIYTPDLAAKLRQKYYLSADSDYPLIAEMDGMLYTQAYHSSTNGFSEEFQFTNLQWNGSDTVIVSYQSDSTPFVEPNMVEAGTITFEVTVDGWRIAALDWGYQNTDSSTAN